MNVRIACLAFVLAAAAGAISSAASAAELKIRPRATAVAPIERDCGCCGCLIVRYERHRRLAMSYDAYFDPRERQEPRYYWGGVRRYPRYSTIYSPR